MNDVTNLYPMFRNSAEFGLSQLAPSGVNIKPKKGVGLLGMIGSSLPFVGNAIQSAIDFSRGEKSRNDQNAYNRQMAEYEFNRNLDLWKMTNEYNSPAQQMKRFKEAGLNPNLIYSQGSSGLASAPAQYVHPEQNFNITKSGRGIPEMINQYQDYQMRTEQINNMKAQRQNIEAETLQKEISANYLSQSFNYRLNKEMYGSQYAIYQAQTQQIEAKNRQKKINAEINRIIQETAKDKQTTSESVARESYTKSQDEIYKEMKRLGIAGTFLNILLRNR